MIINIITNINKNIMDKKKIIKTILKKTRMIKIKIIRSF